MPDNPQAKALERAMAHIWVFDVSIDNAKERAIRYINEYDWNPIKVEFSSEIQPEQIAELDIQELSNYKKAELHGISADFLAWPKEDQPGFYSVESLKKP